ncbi:MAG: nucleoside phosphorylase [Clostridiales bacterium]|jgi:uridine phosphorylase|nr:nucleoside phosphorylase [Clostridiales bacterium]
MILKSKNVLNAEGKQYHICCKPGDIGRYVLLPGDPFRTDLIASFLEDAKLVAHNREHKTWTGTLNGTRVSVASTGMGGPSAAIAVEELIHCGADAFIRIGTAGRVCEASRDESLDGVIVTGSVRDEGATLHYIPVEYPAIASRQIVAALSASAAKLNLNFAEGIAHSKDSFYGQHDPDSMPSSARLMERWEAWKRAGVMCSEMETAALFIVSSIRGCRAGAVMSFKSMEDSIRLACDAMSAIISEDLKKRDSKPAI